MRRTACGLAAAALSSLALAAPASADNEITDPCGPGGVSLPALVNRDVTVPWLDLCSADVRGTAASGTLRGLHVALKLAGDSSNRSNSAAYMFSFATGPCTASLRYEDVVPPAPGGKFSLTGQCGGKLEPCDPPLPASSCSQWAGGQES